MNLGYRIKASEEYADIQALAFVGGRVIDGPYPKFAFTDEVQRGRYDEIRKRIKGGEILEAIARSNHVSGGPSGVPEEADTVRGGRCSTPSEYQPRLYHRRVKAD